MRYQWWYKHAIQVAARLLQNPAKVLELIRKANRKTAETGKQGAAMNRQIPYWKSRIALLGRMVRAYVQGHYKPASYGLMVKAVAALLYFVWWFDLVPDMIPVFGLIDDATVLAWLLKALNEELNRFREWEQANHRSGEP